MLDLDAVPEDVRMSAAISGPHPDVLGHHRQDRRLILRVRHSGRDRGRFHGFPCYREPPPLNIDRMKRRPPGAPLSPSNRAELIGECSTIRTTGRDLVRDWE